MDSLLLVGCGNIGKSLLDVWVKKNLFHKYIIIQPSLSYKKKFTNNPNVIFVENINNIPKNFKPTLTILAIKPQIAATEAMRKAPNGPGMIEKIQKRYGWTVGVFGERTIASAYFGEKL